MRKELEAVNQTLRRKELEKAMNKKNLDSFFRSKSNIMKNYQRELLGCWTWQKKRGNGPSKEGMVLSFEPILALKLDRSGPSKDWENCG